MSFHTQVLPYLVGVDEVAQRLRQHILLVQHALLHRKQLVLAPIDLMDAEAGAMLVPVGVRVHQSLA